MRIVELSQTVWRIGFRPSPWQWSDWRWAGADGRFNGRWDPLDQGLYRTIYAGDSLLACLLEVLAPFRPDPRLVTGLEEIVEDDEDHREYPTVAPGALDLDSWLQNRVAGSATLSGRFVDITAATTIAALHPLFYAKALAYNLEDFDASALKNAKPRVLTQEVSQYLWARRNPDGTDLCDGIQFRSRHGDDLLLWAVFERETDGLISRRISSAAPHVFDERTPELMTAMMLLGLVPSRTTTSES